MTRLVKLGKTNPYVRTLTLKLIENLRQKDRWGEIKTIHSFVQNNIRYVRDISDVETVHFADQILRQRQGDCDDKSLLVASMLESIGFKTRFVAVGLRGGPFCHVFAQVKFGKNWISLETTEPQPIGWTPPNITKTMVRHN